MATPLTRLPWRSAVRSLYSIVPYSMPKELPPYMSMASSEQSTTQSKPILRMLLFGKPCSGKGTLAARLSQKYDITTISTGDLLRRHITDRLVVFFGEPVPLSDECLPGLILGGKQKGSLVLVVFYQTK